MGLRLLIVVNDPGFFCSHRLPIALAARESGFEVHVATGPGKHSDEIQSLGFVHHRVRLSRSGCNPLMEIGSLWALYSLMHRVRPDLVHLVTIKPVLYGGLAARLARVPSMVAAISGLGGLFVASDERVGLLQRLVHVLYRLALGHTNSVVIFQNTDDRRVLESMGALRPEQPRLIRGSGVALEDYPVLPAPADGPAIVTMAARLLVDKGVCEFVEAARILADRGVSVEFRVIGAPDPGNPATVTDQELTKWSSVPNLRLLGFRRDIAQQYAASHIVALPSYYGEGLPKSLIEAAACGRVIVTTDMPGCRDAIEPGKSGMLIPPRDATALADAIQHLIEHPEKRRAMGEASRKLAEREFAIEKIVAQHLAIYDELEHSRVR